MSLSPIVMRRLAREIANLQRAPPEGIGIEVGEHDLLDINGWIQGPAGTPYAGGYFRVNFSFIGSDFPAGPPRCTMRTKVFHPNIAANGDICVSTLKKDWCSSYGIEHILVVIKCLLISPNPDSALDPEAGRLLQEAYSDYASTAAIWTRVHASHRPECMPEDVGALSSSPLHLRAGSSSDLEPPVASFQNLALHPHKKRDVGAVKSPTMESEDTPSTQLSNGTIMTSSLGVTAQPLRRSGSTNADLKHKSSFDLVARSGSGVANWPAAPLTPAHESILPRTTSCDGFMSEPNTPGTKNEQRQQSQVPCLNAETEHMTRRLRNVSLDTQSHRIVSSSSLRTIPRYRPAAIVRRGIKRL